MGGFMRHLAEAVSFVPLAFMRVAVAFLASTLIRTHIRR